jgi:hypothetical protein
MHYDAEVSAYAGELVEQSEPAVEIYSRLLGAEEMLFPAGDYLNGSALVDDKVLILHGLSRILLTAEHASIHLRKGEPKEADMGTGSLAEVVAQDTNSTAIIAAGRQTSDANYTLNHPVKEAMAELVRLPENRGHFALHMLDRGRASHASDEQGYSFMLGIGKSPSEATLEAKDKMLEFGSDLGAKLRVGVNEPHITFKDQQLNRHEDGSVKTVTFAAAGPNTTRTYSQSLAERLGKNDSFVAMQIEINEVLLVKQNDEVDFDTITDRELGAYIGYLFTKKAVEIAASL